MAERIIIDGASNAFDLESHREVGERPIKPADALNQVVQRRS